MGFGERVLASWTGNNKKGFEGRIREEFSAVVST